MANFENTGIFYIGWIRRGFMEEVAIDFNLRKIGRFTLESKDKYKIIAEQ